MAQYERQLLAAALAECHGLSQREISRLFGISVPTLQAKKKKYGLAGGQ